MQIDNHNLGFMMMELKSFIYCLYRGAAFCAFILLLSSITTIAQDDGLNLPTELYVLLNNGMVEQYGVGAAGVQTITPEDAFVLDFAVSPDGNWMAYRTEENLALTSIVVPDVPDIAIESGASADVPPVRGRGNTMVWSPGGDALAYTTLFGVRVAFNLAAQPQFTNISMSAVYDLMWSPGGTYLAAQTEPDVWWIYHRDGNTMNLASAIPVSRGVTWLDDALILFAPDEGGLRTMDLADANAQALFYDASNLYLRPYTRPDGSVAVFSRSLNAADQGDYGGAYRRLVVNNGVVSEAESSDILVDTDGLRWVPRGELLIASRGGALALVLPQSGEGFTLPIVNAVTYGWGAPRPDTVTGFTLSYDGFFLAPTSDGTMQVWRLPRSGLPPLPLTAASADVTDYAISRDRLAYVSDDRIWIQPFTTGDTLAEAVEITTPPETPFDLAFNPGGETLAFATASTQENPQGGIWFVSTESPEAQAPQLILPNEPDGDYVSPQFAPNVNALLVTRVTGEDRAYFYVDNAANEIFSLGLYERAQWLSGGQVLGIGWNDGSVLEVIDASFLSGEPTTIMRAAGGYVEAVREITPGQLRVVLSGQAQPGDSFYNLLEVDISQGEPDELTSLDYMSDPVISPDGEFIAGYSQPDGALLIYSSAQQQTAALRSPAGVLRFLWATFR